MQALVALNLRLMKALASDKRARGMYELYIRQGIEQQAAARTGSHAHAHACTRVPVACARQRLLRARAC
eukprot:3616444-Pleurochrysis_carterae.AAC.2